MLVASAFAERTFDSLKNLLEGGSLTIYSVARPSSPDHPVDRSGVLAVFTFASPAFAAPGEREAPIFVDNPVTAKSVGTPGFARARRADGAVVADFSAGPGDREIKFAEVSFSHGAPVTLTAFRVLPEAAWPERPDYYRTRPRTGFPLHQNP